MPPVFVLLLNHITNMKSGYYGMSILAFCRYGAGDIKIYRISCSFVDNDSIAYNLYYF